MIKVEGAAKIKVSKSKTSIPVLPKGRRAQEGQKTTYNILWLVLKAILSKYHKIDESNSKTTSQGRQGIVERRAMVNKRRLRRAQKEREGFWSKCSRQTKVLSMSRNDTNKKLRMRFLQAKREQLDGFNLFERSEN